MEKEQEQKQMGSQETKDLVPVSTQRFLVMEHGARTWGVCNMLAGLYLNGLCLYHLGSPLKRVISYRCVNGA